MRASQEPRKRSRLHPARDVSPLSHRLRPLALMGTVGAILILSLVLATGCLTGGESEGPSGATFSPPPSDLQQVGLLEVSTTDVDLGRVALDDWVDHTFLLRNVSTEAVTVTIPKGGGVETLDGCCPPTLVAGPATTNDTFVFNNMAGEPIPLPASATLEPGEELKITVVMKMHADAGMDGPHLFRLRLLVAGQDGEVQQTLELHIRGFFG